MKAFSLLTSLVTCSACAVTVTAASEANAEPEQAVDVIIHDAPPPHRILVIEWNPLPLVAIGKASANVVVTPGDHHALVLSPFYARTTTAPIYVFDDSGNPTQLPAQKFNGFGGELGYRYYASEGGPRGFFVGPSIVLASFKATASDGVETPFVDYGLAADVGFQTLIADCFSLSFGAGAQYVLTTKSIPDQQFPARLYANRGLSPRLLLSFGWAF